VLRIGFGRDRARHPLRASLTDAAIMAALVFGLPLYLGLSWPQFARQTPDLTAWIVAMGVLTVIAGTIRFLRRPGRDVG
ncbi:MAG: hypothetical protein V2J51_14105, partial [Erythrobacter sp.]|nr:hypothetical protein [Erythrobacter sp.]